MFNMKNKEISVEVDLSTLPCGVNGDLYFVSMEEDGGKSRFPNAQIVQRLRFVFFFLMPCLEHLNA